ncbi:MAG: PIN domain-containing protein [Planctomycetes bacterium]|nr:PIN domain-containing protein [Planctomycetota bacterium]
MDTSVWSLAFRRDRREPTPEARALARYLSEGEAIFTTGIVLQEILQGLAGPKAREAILERFQNLPFIEPSRNDHVAAADLRNACRRRGVQVGTIDALLAQICIGRGLQMFTTDQDFEHVARLSALQLHRVR